ncbi:MAG: hypothetical protein JKY41_03830 [Rhodobacteraceae bacterium]|nr:hypothetical protein [Paracoccaceae bacterium]
MFSFKKTDKNLSLMQRMSKTVGVDFTEAIVDGSMSPKEYRNAVLKCTGCKDVDACVVWLERHPIGAAETPEFCGNRELMGEWNR